MLKKLNSKQIHSNIFFNIVSPLILPSLILVLASCSEFRVSGGEGSTSDEETTTITAPAEDDIDITAGAGTASIEWVEDGSVTSYSIKYGTSQSGPFTQIDNITPPYSLSGLTAGEYWVYVISVDSDGEEYESEGTLVTVSAAVPTLSYGSGTKSFPLGSSTSVSPTSLVANGATTTCAAQSSLPTGLSLNASTCVISGTPTGAISSAAFTIRATNSAGNTDASVTIAVVAGVPTLSYSGATGTTITVSSALSVSPTTLTTNGAAITACGIKSGSANAGSFPGSLSVHASTCVISGTPTVSLSATTFTLEATNSAGVSSAATVTLTLNPGAPSQLGFIQGPTDVLSDAAISPAITVGVLDANGNLVTTASDTVTLSFSNNPGSAGTLSGTLAKATSSGVATFSDISIDVAADDYALQAVSTNAYTLDTSGDFDVTAGAAADLIISGATSTGVDECTAYTVSSYDAAGNLSNVAANHTVALSEDGAGAGTFYAAADTTCVGSTITTVQISSGTSSASFYFKNDTAEDLTLTASTAALTNDTHDVTVAASGIEHIITGSGTSSGVETVTVTKPAGIEEGDVLIAHVAAEGGYGFTGMSGAGWTQIGFFRQGGVAHTSHVALYRVATGSEAASYTLTVTGSSGPGTCGGSCISAIDASISVYRNVDNSSPIEASSVNENSDSSSPITTGSINTTSADAMLVLGFSAQQDLGTVTPSAGLTTRLDSYATSTVSLVVADGVQEAAGASGAKTLTYDGFPQREMFSIIALKPAP